MIIPTQYDIFVVVNIHKRVASSIDILQLKTNAYLQDILDSLPLTLYIMHAAGGIWLPY